MRFMVPMDRPMRVRIGKRAHMLAFGGPGHEVVVDGRAYEVMFGGPPRMLKIGKFLCYCLTFWLLSPAFE